MSLLLNMLSRLVITFLPRSKRLLISWLQSPSAVILEPPKIKSDTVFAVCPSICREVMGPDAVILIFWMLSFKPTFSLSSFHFHPNPSPSSNQKHLQSSPNIPWGAESSTVYITTLIKQFSEVGIFQLIFRDIKMQIREVTLLAMSHIINATSEGGGCSPPLLASPTQSLA